MILAGVVLNYFFLLCPILVTAEGIFLSEDKKFYFVLRFFGLIKILSGYVEVIKGGVAVHISSKKAIIMTLSSMKNIKTSIKPFMGFNVKSVNLLLEIGNENVVTASEAGFLINFALSFLKPIFNIKKPYLTIDKRVDVYEGEKFFNLYFKSSVLLNNLVIILSVVKILWGKITNGSRKQKQN